MVVLDKVADEVSLALFEITETFKLHEKEGVPIGSDKDREQTAELYDRYSHLIDSGLVPPLGKIKAQVRPRARLNRY